MDVEKFFEEILPRVDDFGRYALAIQNNVHSMSKGSDPEERASNALTDADFIVQEGLLRFFLEKKYNFKVYAEETSPYLDKFPKESEFIVSIDPIDGTLAYKSGLPNFCIVIGVYKNFNLVGTLVHTPFDGKFYCATVNREHAWILKPSDLKDEYIKNDFLFSKEHENEILTYKLSEKKVKKIEALGIKVNEVDKIDKWNPRIGINSIFRGEIAAYLIDEASALDWGPISLIVEKAGGVVSDYNGKSKNIHRYKFVNSKMINESSIIVSSDKDFHKALVDASKSI